MLWIEHQQLQRQVWLLLRLPAAEWTTPTLLLHPQPPAKCTPIAQSSAAESTAESPTLAATTVATATLSSTAHSSTAQSAALATTLLPTLFAATLAATTLATTDAYCATTLAPTTLASTLHAALAATLHATALAPSALCTADATVCRCPLHLGWGLLRADKPRRIVHLRSRGQSHYCHGVQVYVWLLHVSAACGTSTRTPARTTASVRRHGLHHWGWLSCIHKVPWRLHMRP